MATLLKLAPRMTGVLTLSAPSNFGDPQIALFMLQSGTGLGAAVVGAGGGLHGFSQSKTAAPLKLPSLPILPPIMATSSSQHGSGLLPTTSASVPTLGNMKSALGPGIAATSGLLGVANSMGGVWGSDIPSSSSGWPPLALRPPPSLPSSTTPLGDKSHLDLLDSAVMFYLGPDKSSTSVLELMEEIERGMPRLFKSLGSMEEVAKDLVELKYELFKDAGGGLNIRRGAAAF